MSIKRQIFEKCSAKMDRRIQKTEEQILKATLKLLNEYSISDISVKQICNEANVSRSTFYLHYLSPKDVVERLYTDVAVTLTNILDDYDLSTNVNPTEFLTSIFEAVDLYKDYFGVLLTTGYHSDFRRRLKKILEEKVLNDNAHRYRDLREVEYQISFLISGLVECICDNIEDFFNEDNKQLLFNILDVILTRLSTP